LNVLLLRQKESLSGGELNLKKVPQRIKIRHKKLITKMSLNKGNIVSIISSDDHIIHIKKIPSSDGRSPRKKRRQQRLGEENLNPTLAKSRWALTWSHG
jgi:hypothetical protein